MTHRKPDPPASSVAPAADSSRTLAIVWLWLGIYFTAFLLAPISSAPPGTREAISRGYLASAVFLIDQLAGDWFGGFTPYSIVERGFILLVGGAILTVAISAGWLVLRLLRVDRVLWRAEMSLFAIGIGLQLVSLFTLLAGLTGTLRPDLFAGAGIATCAAAGFVYWRLGCASAPMPTHDNSWASGRGWWWIAGPFVIVILLAGMLPPWDFDVREYHLQAPKEFYQAGRIEFLPHNVYANMPLGAEMLALAAMVLTGDWWTGALVGKTLIAFYAPLTAVALYLAGRRFASPLAGVVAALVYLSIPWVALVSGQGLIEGVFGFYLFAAFYAALLARSDSEGGVPTITDPPTEPGAEPTQSGIALVAIAGILSGAAASTKYPAVLYSVLPLGMLVAAWSFARRDVPVGKRLLAPIVFLLAAGASGGAWYAKNAALTGNPTYPLLYRVFDGATRTPEKESQWQQAHRPPNYHVRDFAGRSLSALLTSDWLSPLAVSLGVLGFLPNRTRKLAFVLGGYLAFVFVAWWLLTHRIERFLVPVLPLVALLAGLGATWSASTAWRRSLVAVMAIGLGYSLLVLVAGAVLDNRFLAELGPLKHDPQRVEPWHRYFNEHADDVNQLLLIADAQPFDLIVPADYNTVFDTALFEELARDKSPAEVRRALAERGISHVYVSWSEINRYRSPGNYGITDFLQPRMFDSLVKAGVLVPLPPLPESTGQAFRVAP